MNYELMNYAPPCMSRVYTGNSPRMNPYQMLDRKRLGQPWSPEEIRQFVEGFMSGAVADYQMTAFLMAVAIHGLSPEEGAALTRAMLESGEQWALRERFPFVGDKHSTGGVGDKVSICLTPWVAACGVPIAMLSGRGLGHTGGTLDKLDTIPGFEARLSRAEIEQCLETVGCAIATSTDAIAPADRRLYALRDVTGTVRSIPLITASIMSKKLAMGASALILDIKMGRGAFMQTLEEARELAHSLMAAASGSGTRVEALITSMDQPLGCAIGNANEIREAIEVLHGRGPDDLTEVTRIQARRLLVLSGRYDENEAAAELDRVILDGRAAEKGRAWIEAQGGDPEIVDHPRLLAQPAWEVEVTASRSGIIRSIDPLELGLTTVELGAGRSTQADQIDPAAGIVILKKRGDLVEAGEGVAIIQIGARPVDQESTVRRVREAFSITDEPDAEPVPLLLDHLT
jgi:pyrimidine-nucleoside phosphorylase